jgi:hypothetical protein
VIGLLVSVLVACIILGLLYWIFTLIPLPAPFAQIARVVIVVIFCIWLIYLLLPLIGAPGVGFSHPTVR